jgi:hypothetical protein
MQITRTNPFTGKTNTREINVTYDQLDRWQGGELIQVAMPHLSADDREFVKSGIDNWAEMFDVSSEELADAYGLV